MESRAKCTFLSVVIGAALGWAVSSLNGCVSKTPKSDSSYTTTSTVTSSTVPRQKPDTVDCPAPKPDPDYDMASFKVMIDPYKGLIQKWDFKRVEEQLYLCESREWFATCID